MTTDLYAVLGVSPSADLAEIRAQFRNLVREFHPDVAVDKLAAHERFVQIVDAYKTLSDVDKRGQYDAARRVNQRKESAPRYSWKDELHRQTLDSLMVIAELFFIRGQVESAIAQCRRVLTLDPNNAAVHGLLGDFLRATGQRDEALHAYTMAAQLSSRPKIYEQKIERLIQGENEGEEERRVSRRAPAAARVLGMASLVCASAPVAVVLAFSDRQQLWATVFPAWQIVGAAVISSFLLGFGMTLLRWLGHADEEIFDVSFGATSGAIPVGIWILAVSTLSFYLALASYVVIAIFEEHVSWSMVKVLGAAIFLIAVFAFVLSDHYSKVLVWGGNLVLPSLLIGWSIGSMGRSRW